MVRNLKQSLEFHSERITRQMQIHNHSNIKRQHLFHLFTGNFGNSNHKLKTMETLECITILRLYWEIIKIKTKNEFALYFFSFERHLN